MGAKGFKNSLKWFERKELKKKYDSVKFTSMKSIIQYLATSTVIIFKEWWKSSVVEEWKEFFEKMKESKSSLTIIILENGMEKKFFDYIWFSQVCSIFSHIEAITRLATSMIIIFENDDDKIQWKE